MIPVRLVILQLAVVVVGLSLAGGQIAVCPPPPLVSNSEVRWQDRTLGAYATYSCSNGYEMVGLSNAVVLYCNETGQWIGPMPECRRIQCPPASIPAFGNVTYPSGDRLFGSLAIYRCETDYSRVGPIVAQCRADGTWSKPAPVCRLFCESPTTTSTSIFEHATDHICLEYSGRDNRQDWGSARQYCDMHEGSLAIITDEAAQEAVGNQLADVISVGGSDSFWIGATEQMSAVPSESRSWLWVDGSPVEETFWGPDEPTTSMTSRSRGECVDLKPPSYRWNDKNCSREQRFICRYGEGGLCSDPGVPYHGRRTLLSCDEGFTVGCLLTVQCEPGYRLVGESALTCEQYGTWSEALPVCEPRRCMLPPPPIQSMVTMSDSYRGVAVYSCPNDSYPVSGDLYTYCQQNGIWKMPTLQCQALSTTAAATTTDYYAEPDWTFIGTVGSLGILLIIAILVIILLAKTQRKRLDMRSDTSVWNRPLPSTTGRKRRSDEVTYYSIRYPQQRFSNPDNGHLEMSKKRISDAGAGDAKRREFTQHDATYGKDQASFDDTYLEPMKEVEVEGSTAPSSTAPADSEVPTSPRSGDYDAVADDEQDEQDLANNYLVVLPDKEESVSAPVSSADQSVDVKSSDQGRDVTSGRGGNVTEPVPASSGGLKVTLTHSKDDYGSTVEL